MAPPTIAPPIKPAARPAATPRCALAGVEASAPAMVATARRAEIVFFISVSLLEVAPKPGAGFKVYSPVFELTVSPESVQPSTWSKRYQAFGGKNGFFVPKRKTFRKLAASGTFVSGDGWWVSRKPGRCERASHNHPRIAGAASSSPGRRRRRGRRNIHSPGRNSRFARRSRRRRWHRRSVRPRRPRQRLAGRGPGQALPSSKAPRWPRPRWPAKFSSWLHPLSHNEDSEYGLPGPKVSYFA